MRRRIARICLILVLIPLILTGCLFGPEEKATSPIDPPPKESKQKEDSSDLSADQPSAVTAKEKSGVELYVKAKEGYLVPYTVGLPRVEGIAKEAVTYLIKDGPAKSVYPEGLEAVLPKETEVKGINIKDGTATVDFSKGFLSYDAAQEEEMLSAITWTLTGFDSVKRVDIQVNGHPLEVMPKKKTPAQNLTRQSGINLELAEGVNIGRSMPVILYFLGQLPDNSVVYVPVTRMVNQNDDLEKIVLNELVKGPKQGTKLSSALAATTQINSVKLQGDTVSADFGEQLLQHGDEQKVSADAIRTIVLSLTENTVAKKVKISVDGKADIGSQGNQPVTRPKQINPSGV